MHPYAPLGNYDSSLQPYTYQCQTCTTTLKTSDVYADVSGYAYSSTFSYSSGNNTPKVHIPSLNFGLSSRAGGSPDVKYTDYKYMDVTFEIRTNSTATLAAHLNANSSSTSYSTKYRTSVTSSSTVKTVTLTIETGEIAEADKTLHVGIIGTSSGTCYGIKPVQLHYHN